MPSSLLWVGVGGDGDEVRSAEGADWRVEEGDAAEVLLLETAGEGQAPLRASVQQRNQPMALRKGRDNEAVLGETRPEGT